MDYILQVEAERDDAIAAAQLANDKAAAIEVDLDAARAMIAQNKQRKRSAPKPREAQEPKERKAPATPYKQLLKEVTDRKAEILKSIKDKFGTDAPLFQRTVDPRMAGGYEEATLELFRFVAEMRGKYGIGPFDAQDTDRMVNKVFNETDRARYQELQKAKDEAAKRRDAERPLAPNGKPSNLSPDLHKLVRTPEFKRWFGDWEKYTTKELPTVWHDQNGRSPK